MAARGIEPQDFLVIFGDSCTLPMHADLGGAGDGMPPCRLRKWIEN